MGNAINLTPYAVGELAGKDADGMPLFVAVVKATWEWQPNGTIQPVAPAPIQDDDEFAGEPATSGLARRDGSLPLRHPQQRALPKR